MEDTQAKAYGGDTTGLPQSWPATVEAMLVPMYRFIRALAPAEAVDDLVQETFAAASRGINQFDRRCPLWHWLTAIARNKIADHHRRSGSRPVLTQSIETLNSDGDQVQQALLSESPLPDEICERREFQALARAALASLSPDQQECLVGRYYEDLSLDELGRHLGASPSLANTRLYRARQALRQAFLRLLGAEGDDQESSP
jgi:RNA polymerase sigma-70 factor (ECF subfamily)